MRHFDGFQRLGYRADLIELDQDGVAASQFDPLFQSFCIGYKKIVPDKLHPVSQLFRQDLPSVPVLLVQPVLNGIDRIFRGQDLPVIHQLFRSISLSALRQDILPGPATFPFTGRRVHGQHEFFSWLIACPGHRLKNIFDGFIIS